MTGCEDTTCIALAPVVQADDRKACLIVMAGVSLGEMFPIETGHAVIGRSERADFRVLDEGVSREHMRVRIDGDRAVIEDLGSTNGTYCNGDKIDRAELHDGDKLLIGATTVLKFTYHDQIEETFQRQMYESALRDGMTKAFNKKYLLDRLESEFAYSIRHLAPLSLILFDLDHLKDINDMFGHPAGDRVLCELAQRTARSLRTEDVFARFGGDEFAVVCRGVDLASARAVAERLRKVAGGRPFAFDQKVIPITISLGIAAIPGATVQDAAALVAAADGALYQAKRNGRNQVCVKQA